MWDGADMSVLIAVSRRYQRSVSPVLPAMCRYDLSRSRYARGGRSKLVDWAKA